VTNTEPLSLKLSNFIIRSIADRELRSACLQILNYPEFLTWPASLSFHHARACGLLEHTLEVAEYALHGAESFPETDLDVLAASALWHDLGKIWEYNLFQDLIVVADGIRYIHEPTYGTWVGASATSHILTSSMEFTVHARRHGVAPEIERAVVHCIHAHHGPVKEWGSPVAPQSLEALLLHQADMLSAKHGATK
jgi:3'-5' exoribonuclease